MKKLQIGKISTLFVILISVITTVFVCVLIYISNLQTPREKANAESERIEKIERAEFAQSHGMTPEEYEKKRAQNSVISKHLKAFENGVIANDKQKMEKSLPQLRKLSPALDFSNNRFNPYQKAAYHDNEDALKTLYELGVPCDYTDPVGKKLLTNLLVNTAYFDYFDQLVEMGCDIGIDQDPIDFQTELLQKQRFKTLLKYPVTENNKKIMNKAFVQLLYKNDTDAAMLLLNKGVSPSWKTGGKTKHGDIPVLHASILQQEPEIAIKLIEKGADVTFVANRGKGTPLELALENNQIAVVNKILEVKPNPFLEESNPLSHHSKAGYALSLAIAMKSETDRVTATKKILETGLEIKELKNQGAHLLQAVISKSDVATLKLLLESGFDPSIPFNRKMSLNKAKASKHEDAPQMIKLLEQYNAEGDFLASVRTMKNIGSIRGCEKGQKIELPVISDALQKKMDSSSGRLSKEPEAMCLMIVANCVNEGVGMDDCVYSAKECSGNFKVKYNEARCSGLSVYETMDWLDSQL